MNEDLVADLLETTDLSVNVAWIMSLDLVVRCAFVHERLDSFGAELAGSWMYCTALHHAPTTSPIRKPYATKATGLCEPLYLATNELRRL